MRTVKDNQLIWGYVFGDLTTDPTNFIPFKISNNYAITQKNLVLWFHEDDTTVSDYTFSGLYYQHKAGFTVEDYFLHPLTEEELRRDDDLSQEEGRESYFRYLQEVRGINPADFTEEQLEGDPQDGTTMPLHLLRVATEQAGELKDVEFP